MPATILLVADTGHRYGRDVLAGVDEAARPLGWRILLENPDVSRPEVDGAIGFPGPAGRSWHAALVRRRIPVVLLGRDVVIDEGEVGRCAARHLRERGLEHGAAVDFAAMGAVGAARCDGFRAAMGGGVPLIRLPIVDPPDQIPRLVPWLSRLPRPVGVFAPNDYIGQIVLAAAAVAGIDVPGRCAVVGVDNDIVRCASAACPLSSVGMPHARQGQAAVARLQALLAGRDPGAPDTVRPGAVCARASTDVWHCPDEAVARALGWIRQHHADPLRVDAVAAAAGLNRRALERRFRATLGRSVHDQLRRTRIARAQEMLSAETSLPVAAVAAAVGLSPSAFAAAFAAETGCRPGAWRDGRGG